MKRKGKFKLWFSALTMLMTPLIAVLLLSGEYVTSVVREDHG